MAAEEESDTLKIYWNHFFKSETGTYEKSTWLELFLAEFIIRLNEGSNPKDLIKFCPVSGVVTLVGCELLCGIHRVTSSISAHYAPPLPPTLAPTPAHTPAHTPVNTPANSDTTERAAQSRSVFSMAQAQARPAAGTLRRYLQRGAPWRCLLLLRALGVEGLSCCRQLSSVLIWVFGELGAATPDPEDAVAKTTIGVEKSRLPIHELFSNRIWSKQKHGSNTTTRQTLPPSEYTVSGRSKPSFHNKIDSGTKSKQKSRKNSEHSSDSGNSNDDLQILNRNMTIKVCSPSDDFDYFNSPKRSPSEFPTETLYSDPYYVPRKAKPKAEDYMTEKHRSIINSEISTFEFTIIITDLLQELCKAESSLSGSEGSQISMQCINFALKNLCTLQFGSLPSDSEFLKPLEMSIVKLALTELLIVSLDQVLVHNDLCAKLINNGILPMLLRILEDVICKSNAKYNTKLDRQSRAKEAIVSNKVESENLLKYVFGIAYSITAFFHCLLMQCRSVDKLREFTDQFKLYGECLKGGLLKECIELMIRIPGLEEEETVILIKRLIETIGKLISGMKRVRSEVIHSAACPKSRHKVCRPRVVAGMHHHHDILGEAGTGLPLPSSCCVSVLYGTLASLVPDEEISAQKELRNKILNVMLKCGVCCCFSPSFLMDSIVRLMLTHNNVASLCLRLLEHTVYGDLGASVLIPKVTDQLPCSICEQCDSNRDLGRKYCPHGVSPMERKSVWSFLIHYNSLLQLDNHNNVLQATVSHLLKVTPKCRMEMKYELLFSVIYPTFIVSKHRYIMRMEESAYFLTVSCLNIFASLLNTVTFAEQFIQKGGLSYVLELVSMSEFSNQCCAILEIAIVVEIFKLIKENEEMTYFREMSSLASVQMLFKSLSEMTDRCYQVYKLKLPPGKCEELCDVSKEKEMLAFDLRDDSENVRTRNHSTPVFIKTGYVVNENSTEDLAENYMEVLKTACTFWKSCAGLCLYSPQFRAVAVREPALADSYALLKLVLHHLCGGEREPHETRVLIKIMEALLTVQFAVSDVTSGRSKQTSCVVVRSALSARAAAGGGGLRPLCDALVAVAVAVAVASPAGRRAMPTLAPTKVPPLLCSSGGSSECSSNEESASCPDASDHSEPKIKPDDGYEADVEIGKLDASGTFKPRKLSSSLSTLSEASGVQIQESISMEYPDDTAKNGELPHPELCVIVVDILSQLIDKLLKSECSDKSRSGGVAELERVCSGLARAWGAAGAPALLRRLLAPGAPAARLLAAADPALHELQSAVVSVVVAVSRGGLGAGALAALLRPLARAPAAAAPLLRALHTLLPPPHQHTPDHTLLFPCRRATGDEAPPEDPATFTYNQQAESSAKRLHLSHLQAGVWSAWAASAVRLAAEGTGWAAWLQGFSLTVWLQLRPATPPEEPDDWQDESPSEEPKSPKKESSKATDLIHLVSLGHESLMFEVWVNVANGSVSVRVSRAEAGASRVVGAARAEAVLPARRCCLLALAVRDLLQRRRILLQVTIYVDGRECETLNIPVQGILVRKASPVHVLVGEARAGGAGGGGEVAVSSVSVLRAPVLTQPAALHLAAHGPDHPCQPSCESPHFPSIITPELLDMNIDWDQMYEVPSGSLRELHDSLLLTYAAHAPRRYCLYHHPAAPANVWGARGVGTGEPPESVGVAWAGEPRAHRHRGFAPSLLLLGGIDLLFYLYARVVESGCGAGAQAAALALAARGAAADARLAGAARDRLPLLLPLLAAPAARLEPRTVQALVDAACSGRVLSTSGARAVLARHTTAVLTDPAYLALLFTAWRDFDAVQMCWEEEGEKCSGSGWELILACANALLRPAHPRLAFNYYQADRVDLLRHLLLATKERFLNSARGSDEPAMSERASDSLVTLARRLLGRPPQLRHVAQLADFLLLMHQASDTFVTHSRANFYFLLTTDTAETSDFNFLDFIAKRKKSKDSERNNVFYDTADRSSSSSISTDEVTAENNLNDKAGDTDGEKTEPENVDSVKQMKGIINTQIKEVRTNKSSSNSDNSDIPSGESIEKAMDESNNTEKENKEKNEEKESEEDGYVIIDHEKVGSEESAGDVFSTSEYQQVSVRAGASPGWRACEGLLLLLRDAVLLLPDHQIHQAVVGVVQAEVVAALGNHRTSGVRAALVRLAAALAARAPAHLANALNKLFYVSLANQISMYDTSWELASACAALLTGCDVPLEDQLDEAVWSAVGAEAGARAAPLLAVLAASARAAPLAAPLAVPLVHNIAALLRLLLDKVSLKSIQDMCMVEVVVRTIRSVGLIEPDFEGRELLLDDMYDLLSRIAVKALAQGNNMQMIIDMHHLLRYVECATEEAGAGAGAGAGSGAAPGAGVRQAARDGQVALFVATLDHLELKLRRDDDPPSRRGYFTNVLVGGAERAEAAARAAAARARAAAFLQTRHLDPPSRHEEHLFQRVLDTLLAEVSSQNAVRRGGAVSALSDLFWWAVGPAVAARPLQPRLLRALYHAAPAARAALAPPNRDPSTLRKLAVYLLTSLRYIHLQAEEEDGDAVEVAVTDWARDWATSAQAGLSERLHSDVLVAEAERLFAGDRARRQGSGRRRVAAVAPLTAREAMARATADAAMAATRRAVELQNSERKAFLEHLRSMDARAGAANARWRRLADALTHERGVWHRPDCYPASWQLDPTEGPGRVRVRLRRAHLDIPARFLKPEHRHKAERARAPGPLRGVLGAGGAGARAARLQPGELVRHTARVLRVTVAREAPGELLLTDRSVHFAPEGEAGGERAELWPLASVSAVATRRWCLQERALELFLRSGHAHLIAFADFNERATFLKHLARAHLPNRTEQESLTEAMNQWRNGTITNWEYLMILNGLAGRSYNDLMQYPVFPFVIADYTSKILDLTDPASFRDLSKPMAIQNKSREQHYINTYNDLKAARREGSSPLLSRQPHHYASLYSNSGGVLHYLVRLPPFTELFLNYQDNNFDMPDRTFHSMATTWRLITNDSPTDVKELIPELFYLPELFSNNEGLELGVRQCGVRVEDVELSRWAADARLFTLAMRQALEAPLVSDRLPLWIDLVFGYKQTGQPAIDAINVFPACTYYGFDPAALEDEVDRTAAEAMVRTYGQAPRQLLRAPHPQRAADLQSPAHQVPVWAGVAGARWGRYCGSPARAVPAEVARRALPAAAAVLPLAHPRAAAALPPQHLLLLLNEEWWANGVEGGGGGGGSGEGGECAVVVSWGHADGWVRARRRRDLPPQPLLHLPHIDQVTAGCGWSGCVGGGAAGALGLRSGRVLALRASAGRLSTVPLLAHAAPLAALALCVRASLLVSACEHGRIVLWDLNELTYIRTLPNRGSLAVTCVAISPTLSDVASVHDPARPAPADHDVLADRDHVDLYGDHADNGADSDYYEKDATHKFKSLLRVHTVNGKFVGSVKVAEGVTSASYSGAPEGASVNCVAVGLATGGVRLYSSWDLRPATYIPPPHRAPARPVPALSVAYSSDSQVLFACYEDGLVVGWESLEPGARPAPLRLLPAAALL